MGLARDVLLLDLDASLVSRLREIQPTALRLESVETARAVERIARPRHHVAAVVVGGDGDEGHAVTTLQSVCCADRELAVFVLAAPDRLGDLSQQLMVEPTLSSVRCVATTRLDALGAELALAARRRRRMTSDATLPRWPAPRRREGGDYWRHLIDDAPLGVAVLDERATVLTCNRRAGELLGQPASALQDRSLPELCDSPEWRAAWQQLLTPTAATGRSPRRARLVRARDPSRPRHLEALVTETADNGAGAARILLLTDVTEQADAEAEIAETRARLALALHAGRLGAWEWDLETDRMTCSPGFERIHGLGPGAFAATFDVYLQHIHPDDYVHVDHTIVSTLESGRDDYLVEYRILRPDGRVRWLESRGRIVHDESGRAVRMRGVCSDITERKHTALALHRRAAAAALVAAVSTGVASGGPLDTMLARVCRELAGELGDALVEVWLAVDIVADDGDTLPGVAPPRLLVRRAGSRTSEAAVVPAISTGEPALDPIVIDRERLVCDVTDADDPLGHDADWLAGLRLHRLVAVPLLADARLAGLLAVYTEHALDDEFAAALGSLAYTVAVGVRRAQADAEREGLLAELQRAVHLSQLFVGVLGHDLRGPLNAILTSARLVERAQGDPTLGERMPGVVSRILGSGERMARLIEQLLDLTRARLGDGIPTTPRPMSLDGVCRQVIDELVATHPECRIELRCSGDLEGEWDSDRLAQVVSNLGGNALAHGERAHGVEFELDGTSDATVVMTVRNRGTIEAELVPDLFDPFRRAPNNGAEGLGLGLYITERIVSAHGGRIEVDSSRGTTAFTVALPRRNPLAQARERTHT